MDLKKICRMLLLGTAVTALSACSGGGGGAAPANTVVSGVASKGFFTGGTVQVFALAADGTEGTTPIGTATIDANGAYVAVLNSPYHGALIVKASGSYKDEATGATVVVPADHPLTAALPASAVTGSVSVPVTPLTDLAVRKASENGGNVAANIASSNQAITSLFGVDIIATLPVPFEATALSDSKTTADQKKYTAALAAVSQYVANLSGGTPSSSDLQAALIQISGGIQLTGSTATISSPQVIDNINKAASDLQTNDKTKATLTATGNALDSTLTDLGTKGKTYIILKLSTAGAASSSIEALHAVLTVPTVIPVQDGELTVGTVVLSGITSAATSSLIGGNAKTNLLTFDLAFTPAIGNGEVATVYLPQPSTVAIAPALTDYRLASTIVDSRGDAVSGVSLNLSQ